ncbi:MAG: GxxExxY protein [Verrucomicrobiales bacterium]|nr:GxxExxY protein [Verrucomicrobiales bacterium]
MNSDPQTYEINGAAMEVHRELGHGFLEAVYQEALAVELTSRKISFQREAPLQVRYKNQPLACAYKADFICFGEILVELKAIEHLGNPEKAQVINYLNATKFTRALLINFGSPSLEYQRLVLNHPENRALKNLRPSAESAGI